MKQGSDEWHEARRLGVTSTDIVAILGLSPYASEGDVARAKQGLVEDEPDAATARRLRLGHALEAIIASEDEREHGHELRHVDGIVVDPDRPILRTSLDFIRADEQVIVETKATATRDFDDGLPERVEAQVRWQMGVAKYPRAHVAALRSGSNLICFDVEHDQATFDGMVIVAEDFWRRLEAGGPFVETRSSARRAWPTDDGTEMTADEELRAAVEDLLQTRVTLAHLGDHEDALVAAIQTRMGKSSTLAGPGWRVSWKRTKDKEVTNYQLQAADALRALAPYDPVAAEALATIHTSTHSGGRRFLVRQLKDDR